MTTTITDPVVQAVLAELHDTANRHDDVTMPKIRQQAAERGAATEADVADLLADAFMPIDPTNGAILHVLARLRPTPQIVEFGTSHGISTIYLASAITDEDPPIITCELEQAKADAALANLTAAGLEHRVEIRVGDAFESLASVDGPIGMAFLDGWKGAYLPMLQLLESGLARGAIVVADDVTLLPDLCADYLQYVRDPASGYTSVCLPFHDGLELSIHDR